jgi:hypothetical protein
MFFPVRFFLGSGKNYLHESKPAPAKGQSFMVALNLMALTRQ